MAALQGMSVVRPGMVRLPSSALHGVASQGPSRIPNAARNLQSRWPLVVRPGMVCYLSSALHGVASQGNFVKAARNLQSRRSLVVRAAATTNGDVKKEKSYKVTLLPGDGIGPEIMEVAVKVLKEIGSQHDIKFDFTEKLIGGAAIDELNEPLPKDTLDTCKASDAVLLAAIGGYKWDKNERSMKPETGLLALREGLGVFANLRPAVVWEQLVDSSTLKREVVTGVDIMVVRELTGGLYFGEPRGFTESNGELVGYNTMVYKTSEIDRIARVGFETARKRYETAGKKSGKLCSVDKANVLEVSQLWRERVTAMSSEYPDVELSHMYVDNAAMQLIRNPKQFDTIVTGNIFGDIISDEASMLTGSIGMLPSASIGESGPGLYEPIHGSAPDIAGQDKANPLAQILSAAMLLRYALNEKPAAKRIEAAVEFALNEGFRTGDIMSPGMKLVGCKEMGEVVLKRLQNSQPAVPASIL